MSAPSGGYYNVQDFFSPSRHNRKSITQLPGADIAALTTTWPGQIVVCTATGSGFNIDTAYVRKVDNTGWNALSGGAHLHNDDTASAGGYFHDVLVATLRFNFWLNYINPSAGEFHVQGASGGSTTDDNANGRVTQATGATNGAWTSLAKNGVQFSFVEDSHFGFKGFATAGTFVSVRMGAAMETVNGSPDNLRKYGLEACDSAGIARTFDVISADGSARSALATTENVAQASARFYRLLLTPGVDVKYYVNNLLNVTKTTNVPASSSSSGINNLSAGIRTNNGTSKNLYVYGIALAGRTNDARWS